MKIYVVQSQDGKYFRNIGYGGYGKSWRDKLEDAKFYTKIGQAKARVTFWFKNHPEYGCPKIVAFDLNDQNMEVIDMELDTKKSIKNIEKKALQKKISYLEYKMARISTDTKTASQDMIRLQNELDNLKKHL
jgi:hypothetical protein